MAGLYLHIPFCRQRCVYCDFYFVTTQPAHDAFLNALHREIAYWGGRYGHEEPIRTVYFGGGTPSLLSPDAIAGILEKIHAEFEAAEAEEITFELNPDDVDLEYLKGLRAAGVDRLSIGIQSFFQSDLSWMNRAHTAKETEQIVPLAREAGFENISIDLIFGLPDQSAEVWEENLARATALGAPHLSTYSLTVEPRTPLHKRIRRGLEREVSDDVLAERYRMTMKYLKERGYEQYEVSSFALPGFQSKHNQVYWRHENYIGLGPSAHSFWHWEGKRPERWANARSLKRYEGWPAEGAPPIDFKEELSPQAFTDEYIMLGLRTSDGIDLDRMQTMCGAALKETKITALIAAGWMKRAGNRVRLTAEGMLVCDAVTRELLDALIDA